MIIKRIRRLPYAGTALVAVGDIVSADTPVATVNYYPGRLNRVYVGDHLLVNPAEAAKCVSVALGEEVAKGQLLATRSQHWDMITMSSPYDGYVELISEYLGHVWIRERIDAAMSQQKIIIDVSKAIPPANLRGSIKVSPGQQLRKGECIAAGSTIHYVLSPCSAKVTSIEGSLITLQPAYVAPTLLAYVSGEVNEVLSDSTVVICGEGEFIPGVYGLGGEAVGEMIVLPQASAASSSHRGKVVVVMKPLLPGELPTVAACGVRGIIAPSIGFSELCAYAGAQHIPGITGGEDIPAPIVITEGFGKKEMTVDHWDKLKEYEGCTVSLKGTTHIRAGAVRPEVLLWRNF